MWGWCWCAIYTNTLKAYLSTQASSLTDFVISNIHISGQKPHGRQLNAKVCGSESAIFHIVLSCSAFNFSTMILKNDLSAHHYFSTKLMLITAWSTTTIQRLHSFKFTLVSKSHSQHSEVAVHWLGRHFLILYACADEVSFPDQRPQSLVWKRDLYTSEIASMQYAWLAQTFPPMALGKDKAYEHHVGKALHSATYL